MEQHAEALVTLLESCLNHNLKPSQKEEDPPHAKISSDIISCMFLVSIKLGFIRFNYLFFYFALNDNYKDNKILGTINKEEISNKV